MDNSVNSISHNRIENEVLDLKNLRWWRVVMLLLLCTLGAWRFDMEGQLRLPEMMMVVSGLFLVLGLVKSEWKGYVVACTSLGALLWFFGISIGAGIAMIGALVVLILQSSISYQLKVMASVIFFAILIGWRSEIIFASVHTQIAMVLGIFFMFKLVVFLYDQRKNKLIMTFDQAWNYFFMLPNFILFIFPIVDSKVFKQTYLEGDRQRIYEKGILWLVRGFYLLLLYRVLYYYVIPSPGEVKTWTLMVVYHVVNYLLIFRLIGFFFISTGILCLLGYNLPKVFDNMFLANSFSDLWRRLNIYWKDYIMKLFYFPLYFKFRKSWTHAVFKIVLIIFVVNWFMHGYQWFWILGNFPIRDTDVIFWGVFGILVAFNSIYEMRKSRTRVEENKSEREVGALIALQTILMFSFMTVLWTFWTSPSVQHWTDSFDRLISFRWKDLWIIGGTLLSSFFFLYLGVLMFKRWGIHDRTSVIGWHNQLTVLPILLILINLASMASVRKTLSNVTGIDLSGLYEEKLNEADEEQIFEGYYEELIVGSNINSRVIDSNLRAGKEGDEDEITNLNKSGILKEKPDGLWDRYMLPNQEIDFKGEPLSTNEYGLRDRSNYYSKTRKEGTFRMALLGGSIEMGSGVRDLETFENLLEDRLNDSLKTDRIELINFAISGIHLPQQIGILKENVAPFSPDVVLYFAHSNEIFRALKSFAKLMREERVEAFEDLENIRKEQGISRETYRDDRNHGAFLIESRGEELYDWGLKAIHEECEEKGYHCVYIFLQSLGIQYENEFENLKAKAESYNFEILDLSEVYTGYSREELSVARRDRHPNRLGHQLIAEELFSLIYNDSTWINRIESYIRKE